MDVGELFGVMSVSELEVCKVSVVIPVYRGEAGLAELVREIAEYVQPSVSELGVSYQICEVLLVHDCGPDRSDRVIEDLARRYAFVTPVWLSRNFGQHAATMAGMRLASGDYVVTMDEDGQQDPRHIRDLLDAAVRGGFQVVYARPVNPPPHGMLRNFFSRTAKSVAAFLMRDQAFGVFNSFRIIEGDIARELAQFCGSGVYLDIALFWIVARVGYAKVMLRCEAERPSGYSYLRLLGHFWRLVITTGTRPLRIISLLGLISVLLSIAISLYALYVRIFSAGTVAGWTSLVIVMSLFSGAILMSLGLIAEYLAVALGIAMGRPLYVVQRKPVRAPER